MSRIISLEARIIPDSRGDRTIEVTVGIENDFKGTASIPRGKSRGRFEMTCFEAPKAIQNINKTIYPTLKGKNFSTQEELDGFLLDLDSTFLKSNLGANAILGVSLAYARAAALENKIPLWQYIRELIADKSDKSNRTNKIYKTPRLLVNIIGGGLHAKNNLDFQEYLIIPKIEKATEAWEISKKIYAAVGDYLQEKFKNVPLADEGNFAPTLNSDEEPFVIIKKIIKKLGLEDKIDFGLDAAATNTQKSTNELFTQYENLKQKYNLFYLEDPFSEEDFENFAKLLEKIGKNTFIVGDDLTTTNVSRMEIAHQQKSINGVIIKPNQIGTLTETINAVKKAQAYGWAVIVSHRSGETDDSFIADLAYGVGADGLKAGAPTAPERSVKYQRLIEIEK